MKNNLRQNQLTAAILGMLTLPLSASPLTVLVDFGVDSIETATDANGKIWNNVSGARLTTASPTPSLVGSPLIADLVDSAGDTTGISMTTALVVSETGNPGQLKIGGAAVDVVNGVGTSPAGTIHPNSAARDSLFLNSRNLPLENYYEVVLGGLDSNLTYDFHFLAAAEGGADNGNARFSVTGMNTGNVTVASATMKVAAGTQNLDNNFVSVFGMAPDENNEIRINLTSTLFIANTNSNARWNTMEMVAWPDTDGDGLPDWWEELHFGSPTAADPGVDSDLDGRSNLEEYRTNPLLNPKDPDTDGDGLLDFDSITLDSGDPRYEDWETAGISYAESNGLRTFRSELTMGTDPLNPDTDGDGLPDGVETNTGVFLNNQDTGTDPLNPDSDADGFGDGYEVIAGSDPNDIQSLPGTSIAVVNGGFEEPSVELSPSVGVPVSGGTVPGWQSLTNDMWVIEQANFPPDTPPSASESFQFLTADRRAPEPDAPATLFDGGDSAEMRVFQNVDVSALAGEVDSAARTILVGFDCWDTDPQDLGEVSIRFLDDSGADLGRQRSVQTIGNRPGWQTTWFSCYPPTGTRTVRITLAALIRRDNGTVGSGTVRNVSFDDIRLRLFHADSNGDGIPDSWYLENFGSLNDPRTVATLDVDEDGLTNLEEFEAGTNPLLADTDGDGFNDGIEIAAGSDPLDPDSTPQASPDPPTVVSAGFNAEGDFEVTYLGLDIGTSYRLMRGTDLSAFPDQVDSKQPTTATDSFTDPNPQTGKAFYRLESGEP